MRPWTTEKIPKEKKQDIFSTINFRVVWLCVVSWLDEQNNAWSEYFGFINNFLPRLRQFLKKKKPLVSR